MNEAIKTQRFDPTRYLNNPETIASYLQAAIEDGDASALAAALGVVAKAKGMTLIAEQTGLTRESLYKALRDDAQPRFDTIMRVLAAIGLQIKVAPTKAEKATKKIAREHAHA